MPDVLPLRRGSVEIEIADDDEGQGGAAPEGSDAFEIGDLRGVPVGHGENLAMSLDEGVLGSIAQRLITAYEDDKRSSDDHFDKIKDGMDLLGLEIKEVEDPFPGACGASHPLMLEAVIQFQARYMKELNPATGPVRTRVMGTNTHERLKAATRVREYMNFQLTTEMAEYREEEDTMAFWLPLVGSAFKKTYYDPLKGRPVSTYIRPEDFIVEYGTTSLKSCQRYTHVMRGLTRGEVKKMQARELWRDVDLGMSIDEPPGTIKEAVDEIEGTQKIVGDEDDDYTFVEIHADLDDDDLADEDGTPLPYVVTIELNSQQVLALRRNWAESDPLKQRLQWFTRYVFIPGPGFYGLGLVHLLGNLSKTATAVLRSLVDAGMFANLPAGFKLRGARINGGSDPLRFGEFREVEGGIDDVRKAIMPMPVKEPSGTLFQLLGMVVEDGRRLAQITDLNVGDVNAEDTAATAMLAAMEQGQRVMSAVHMRSHAAKSEELRILKRINAENMPHWYPYEVEGGTREIRRQDFLHNIDVVPVSDPNLFSESQRLMRAQAQLSLAQQFPQQHNLYEALYRVHETLGTPKIDDVLLRPLGPKAMDPVTEEFALLHGKPIMAYEHQDHKAHIAAHMSWLNHPQLGMNPQVQQMAGAAMMAHIAEHMAHQYRQEIQAALGMQLPPPPHYNPTNPNQDDGWQPLPPEVENAVAARMVGPAQSITQNAAIAAKAQQNAALMQNPEVQMKMQELQIKKQDSDTKRLQVQQQGQIAVAEHQMDMHQEAVKLAALHDKAEMERQKHELVQRSKLLDHALKLRHAAESHHQKLQATAQQGNVNRVNAALDAAQVRVNKQADAETEMQIRQQEANQGLHNQQRESDEEYQHAAQMNDLELDQQRQEHEMQLEQQEAQAEAQIKVEEAKAQALKKAKIDTVEMGGGGKSGSSSGKKK